MLARFSQISARVSCGFRWTGAKTIVNIPWVSRAVVSRIWPNRIRVELAERTPIAYLRNGTDLSLIDAHGVILDRPSNQIFNFRWSAVSRNRCRRADRELRMALYAELVREMDQVRPGASDHVSEVDLSDADDFAPRWLGSAKWGSQAWMIRARSSFISEIWISAPNSACSWKISDSGGPQVAAWNPWTCDFRAKSW